MTFNRFNSPKLWHRRQFLIGGTGLGFGLGIMGIHHLLSASSSVKIPRAEVESMPPYSAKSTLKNPFDPMQILRTFNAGKIKQENGRTIREYELTANSSLLHLNSGISYISWNINNQVPAPTLRAKEGDRIRVIFHNEDGHSHSLHFHGNHPAEMDGVQGIRHGKTFVYEFDAYPYGVHLYHCHVAPVTRHISKGLYGLFIIDPPQDRPPADEIIMVMGGYDLKNRQRNDLYAFNGIPNYYRDHPIPIYQNQLVRLYLLNMIEFDAAVTFHIHGNLFKLYRTGRSLTPDEESDVVTMGTAERHILEFSYPYPGQYMFHPHQDSIAEYGCMGKFQIVPV